MISVDNYIETKHRELDTRINIEYLALYDTIPNRKLQEIFSTLHNMLVENYKAMNNRLPTTNNTANYWADRSRELLLAFDIIRGLERALGKTNYAFIVDSYYNDIIEKTASFLEQSYGSTIPQGMDKVEIYYTEPIFRKRDSIKVSPTSTETQYAKLKKIGEGSYATVFTFKDPFYNRKFVLKRAKKDLNEKEIERFKQMSALSSPYIVDVFRFDTGKNEYVMEFLNFTLVKYYEKNNSSLTKEERKRIGSQVLHAFQYIHSKGLLHRDISPNNILLKKYDDVIVVKVSDFGLAKVSDNPLTSFNTKFKGWFNDPSLRTEGFYNYSMDHETYALTRLIFYIMTGRTNTDNIKDEKLKCFVEKGLSADKSKRFHSVNEMMISFRNL